MSSGGSAALRPKRQRKPRKSNEEKRASAEKRVIERYGAETVNGLRENWQILNALDGDSEEAKGFIISMISMGMSQIEIRSIIPVGGYRVAAWQKRVALGETYIAPQRSASHKFNEATRIFLSGVMETWNLEEGFPCPHRRLKSYFVEDGMTWKILHSRYEEEYRKLSEERQKVIELMAYSTFTQYVHYIDPGIRLTRSMQDISDSCTRLNLVIQNPKSTEDEKNAAKLELEMHVGAARDQRRAITTFTREYAGKLSDVPLPEVLLQDNLDDDEVENKQAIEGRECEILLIAEDYGQGIPLPYFGFRRPGSDYFNSNLMCNLYIMGDITRHQHNVYLYDERLMGKDKNALCSLRMCHHINERNRCLQNGIQPPRHFISIRDKCVGQNKSNITLKFECFLSMSFYERVLLIFLIPGHSHMVADRIVSWVKRSLNVQNLYAPHQIIDRMNTVKGVKASFIDHRESDRPGYTGWAPLLDKHIKTLPTSFTQNYIFEFFEGKVRMQHLITTPFEDASEIILCPNPELTSRALKMELFGTDSIDNLNPKQLKLPRHRNEVLADTKIKSLSIKYDTIP